MRLLLFDLMIWFDTSHPGDAILSSSINSQPKTKMSNIYGLPQHLISTRVSRVDESCCEGWYNSCMTVVLEPKPIHTGTIHYTAWLLHLVHLRHTLYLLVALLQSTVAERMVICLVVTRIQKRNKNLPNFLISYWIYSKATAHPIHVIQCIYEWHYGIVCTTQMVD